MQEIVPVVPFDYEAYRSAVYQLKRRYPFLQCRVIGRSHAGRAIFSLSIGHAKNPVLMAGGFHGIEWMTTLSLLSYLERLCACIQSQQELCGIQVAGALKGRELLLVPCVNPDGAQIAIHGSQGAGCYQETVRQIAQGDYTRWNANAVGVDINHNFDAGWDILHQMELDAGIRGPAPKQYGGPTAESEPETAALVRLTRLRQPRYVLAIHSQGEEIYWQYGKTDPPCARRLAEIFAAASGFELIQNAGLASHGGYKDWFIAECNRPGFTIEIGKGRNPLPLRDFPRVYQQVEYLYTLASIL